MPAGRPAIYPQMAKKMKRNQIVIVASVARDPGALTLCKELRKLNRVPQYKRVRGGKVEVWWN